MKIKKLKTFGRGAEREEMKCWGHEFETLNTHPQHIVSGWTFLIVLRHFQVVGKV